ncbi:ATP-binding protein [Luteimicrobium subarcticum]|uniref:Anti-sigma regulatory factor (Ser/Thr protein kinase) n=1 Tax=Luteimicrobium subarcticum TaxID=620910 RepID=A0A2M8WU76_9MICO|nr:ATP-binding protein [Luteimicrobium subarcticum]PJI94458.1 anti-sigma regulatory factor (Ser/Thr protein kinase) [Luteimicrobium subarcticum]
MSLASHRAPGSFRVVRTWDLERLEDLAAVRSDLREVLGTAHEEAPSVEQLSERIVLAASELAANALRHGAPPASLRLLTDGEAWVLDALDHAAAHAAQVAGDRAPGDGGYGLLLVGRLSDGVGSYVVGGTKHVWARFADECEEPARAG